MVSFGSLARFRGIALCLIFVFQTTVCNSHPNTNKGEDFKVFINHFLKTTFWGQNIDSLARNASPKFTQFLEPSIGFGRYWNPGAYCYFYDSIETAPLVVGDEPQNRMPAYTPLKLFVNKMPVDGLCEESASKDGIYFTPITSFPTYPDLASGDCSLSCEPYLPDQFRNCPKMEVVILLDHYILKHLYFIKIKKEWYVTFFYDCDCSA